MEKTIADEYIVVTNKRSSGALGMHVESFLVHQGISSSRTEWSSGGVGEGLKKAMVVVVGEGEGEPMVGIS
jgi:hypothetical protein